MRKIIVTFIALCIGLAANALEIETNWSAASEKSLALTCGEDSTCQQFCDGDSCVVLEKVCKNCASTSIAMTFAFKEMGRSLVSGDAVDPYALYDLLDSGSFVSLTSRSIYNLVERFNSSALKRRFRSLCNDGTAYPHAFFETTQSGSIGAPRMVWCNSGVYALERLNELPIDNLADSQLY